MVVRVHPGDWMSVQLLHSEVAMSNMSSEIRECVGALRDHQYMNPFEIDRQLERLMELADEVGDIEHEHWRYVDEGSDLESWPEEDNVSQGETHDW